MSESDRPVFPAIRLPQFADEPLPEVVTAKLHHPVTPPLNDVATTTHAARPVAERNGDLGPTVEVQPELVGDRTRDRELEGVQGVRGGTTRRDHRT